MANFISVICTLTLRHIYKTENQRRERSKAEALTSGVGLEAFEEFVVMDGADGGKTMRRVEKRFLDMTDSDNQAFRYVT